MFTLKNSNKRGFSSPTCPVTQTKILTNPKHQVTSVYIQSKSIIKGRKEKTKVQLSDHHLTLSRPTSGARPI